MARQEKSTRARGLPPRVLLSQRQDATGSFPTVWRTSSDNRTGRYNISFNDNKVVPFNQYEAADYDSSLPLGDAIYVEKVENVGAVETGGTKTVTYPTAFAGSPIVVISELSSANGDSSQNVNVFLSASNLNNFTVKFSSQFTGSFVYRAAYDPSPGTLRVVERKPRYPNAFTRFTVKQTALTASNTTDITFNDFGDDTAENFVTFFDDSGNGQADIWPNITTQTRTLVALTASSIATATVEYERFHGLHNRGIIYPLGMNQATILAGLSQENQIEMYGSVSFISGAVVNQPTKWIVASGSMKKNVADTFITFTPGQDIQAFRDSDNPAVDGKKANNPFYATGSAVTVTGQGFQQPLWSKNKIEIDLTPSTTHTVMMVPTGSKVNYPMMYWNKERNLYEGIGSGTGVSGAYSSANNLNGIRAFLDEQTLGFGTSLTFDENIPKESLGVLARQISSFGFPYHQKFQPTGSQQISMGEYISEPFLLEKIVFEVSSALRVYPNTNGSSPIWTFFLLNSRTNISGSVVGTQTITPDQLNSNTPFLTSSISNGYQLDLVDYFQVAFTGSALIYPGYYFKSTDRELILRNPSYTSALPTNVYYSNQMIISSSVKSSIAYDGVYSIFAVFPPSAGRFLRQDLSISGRSSISSLNGRDWVTSFGKPEILNTFAFPYGPPTVVNKSYTKTNPYLLLPTDKLTIGCQLPWSLYASEYNQVSSSITFSPQGINKITLYGSSLRVNPETNQLEEHHDTLNQLLSSESIHEIITG